MTMDREADSHTTQTPRPSDVTTRRQFILIGLAAVGAAWAGSFVQSESYPQVSFREAEPVAFPLSELPVGGVKSINYGGVPTVVIHSPESIRAYSLVCTHLGCIVEWRDSSKEFYCACHAGRFDKFGEVISGPPPIPLEQFPVKVERDRVIVGEVGPV
jgi:nitrite reductase/ring-hydroxylating ferredoxin subunit